MKLFLAVNGCRCIFKALINFMDVFNWICLAWVCLGFIVGFYVLVKKDGFFLAFFLSLILSPFVGFLILFLLFRRERHPPEARKAPPEDR